MNNFKILETERLILKPINETDLPAYKEHFVDYEVIRYLSSIVPWPYPDDGVEKYFNEVVIPNQGKEKWFWGLHFKSAPNRLIGSIDLWRESKPDNRGFWLGKNFWNRGLMTEAAYAVNDYAFNELGFEKLIFSNALGNMRSRKVKEKTGAKLISIEPASFVDPSYTECEIWELTKVEWLKFREQDKK
ncbi:GNAT family N-acetyltransferase [Vibrio sp. SCSIO 43169]|uniref:GNAT family N-acetyltransferase n=1 Tax=Vibrio sp. SCSIO 43169 TaxID=2822801 RepID=UPI0020436613|nr:GNAT family N-acetyltransferase [Vibrio sp. SCSIO 43169]MCM5511061.1 GNAT family N-acetyltransferase [Vibrio sp. SCSIO 43169]